jgi:hypothetical protein
MMWEVFVIGHEPGFSRVVFVGSRKKCKRIAKRWKLFNATSVALVFPRRGMTDEVL